ncbi:MAG: pyridoxal-phosphate dependent enzyme [Candidatus Bathyarchaeia archaeon]|nr:pyridoxal-phosphate dependent enzyme [Candidatus Bathyarchaeota archaeon]
MKTIEIIEAIYKDKEELKPTRIEEVKGLSKTKVNIFLKREYPKNIEEDPLRTIKRKPAFFILEDLIKKGYINSRKAIISASSGNFARELSLKVIKEGLKLISVVPPKIPRENIKILTALGVDIIHVTEEYDLCPRETTVFLTRALAEHNHLQLVNIDQYNSWQNVLSHLFMTWREIKEQLDKVDYIPVQLGSVGTFMGLSLGNRMEDGKVEIIGVQPTKEHHIPGVHHIVNGCEWTPEIYSPTLGGKVVTIDDLDAYAALIKLWEEGIYAGPSTGMGFAYALKLAEKLKEGDILVISADSVFSYYEYILDFLKKNGNQIALRYPELEEAMEKYKAWLKKALSLKDRIEMIKKIYKPQKEGKIYNVSEVDHKVILKILNQ